MIEKLITVKKKAVQQMGVDSRALSRIANSGEAAKSSLQGIAGDNLIEPVPNFIEAPSEKVLANSNNAWIVMGRDRPGPRTSGYGGKGDTQAASIDIVVGRMANSAKSVDGKGEKVFVDPDFKIDAARIHISQKTDIDENFGLATGTVGTSSAKSGIALKADAIRLVAREGIKLVSSESTKNSQGGDLQGLVGIDLIAGNIDDAGSNADLQPIVKGDNLQEALTRIVAHIENLTGIVDTLMMAQYKFNLALKDHTHHSPLFAYPTAPSIPVSAAGVKNVAEFLGKVKMSIVTQKTNLGMFKQTYLEKSGKRYINSRFNNVN